MTPAQREAVRDAARYLRQIRPIDPAAVTEYVEGQPHPAAVRRVLREDAPTLGLIEREDGTFVPVGEAPIEPLDGPVEALPERYDRVVAGRLADRFGPDWATGEPGEELREAIRQLKADYYRNRDVAYGPTAALGYAVYHLADYYAAVQYVLSTLADRGLLGRTLRVLDVGAGVGGPALGLFDLAGDDALVDYRAIEPSPAAEVLAALLEATHRNVHWTVDRSTAEAVEPDGPYDVVLFANVLSELAEPEAVVERYAEAVSDEGALVLLAPADRETATQLREVERAVEAASGLGVYAPTARLWPDERPGDRCWSFDVRPDLAVPETQRALDAAGGGTGEFVNVDVQFAYAVLRPDAERWLDWTPSADRYAKLADSEAHVTERVDAAAVKLSHDLSEGGHPLFLVGDGSQRTDHYAVLARETGLNDDLRTAGYGDGLAFERVLVLWNDDEGAYNLVVDDETVVDAVPAGAPGNDRREPA
ncbi:MAG: small ribosomal subunit Rsm22 family protein [Halobacteriales archaeon]